MPVADSLIRNFLALIRFVAIPTLIVIVSIYYGLNSYLANVGREVILSWLQAETVTIQQGNLLSAVTKNQRVLLSSQFIKGLLLIDSKSAGSSQLIEFGDSFEVGSDLLSLVDSSSKSFLPGYQFRVEDFSSGFLQKKVAVSLRNRPGLLLVFLIESDFLKMLFYLLSMSLFGFICTLVLLVKRVELREYIEREKVLKFALDEFLNQGEPSPLLRGRFPGFIEWWSQAKDQLEHSQRLAVENRSKIVLGEMAERVAHDIRAPLETLKVVHSLIENPRKDQKLLLDEATERIQSIANEIYDFNRYGSAEEREAPDLISNVRKTRPEVQDTKISEKPKSDMQKSRSGVREPRPGVKESGPGVGEPRSGVKESGPGVRQSRSGVRGAVSGVQESISRAQEFLPVFTLVEMVLGEKRVQHHGKEIEFIFDCSESARSSDFLVHSLEMKRTLSNLIENSVEATFRKTEKPQVTLSLSMDHGVLVLRLSDNGCGISKEDLSRIGERGFTHGKKNGSGLGFYYSKKFVEDLGGQMTVDSQVGIGTVLTMSFAVYPADLYIAKKSTISPDLV